MNATHNLKNRLVSCERSGFLTCDVCILDFVFTECCVSLHSTGICTQEGRGNGRDQVTPLLDRENQQFGIEKVINTTRHDTTRHDNKTTHKATQQHNKTAHNNNNNTTNHNNNSTQHNTTTEHIKSTTQQHSTSTFCFLLY